MGKHKSNRDKERPSGQSGSSTSKTSSTPAKVEHNNPKATTQVPKGAVPSQKPTSSKPPTSLPTSLPTKTPPTPPAANAGGSFQIPKGGDKRSGTPHRGPKHLPKALFHHPPNNRKLTPQRQTTLLRLPKVFTNHTTTTGRTYNSGSTGI